jgi:hypothetical protein
MAAACLLCVLSADAVCRSRFPGVPIYLCNYHVRKAWLKNLRKKVKNEEKRHAMYKALCSLQELEAFTEDGAVDTSALAAAVTSAAAAFVAEYASEADFCTYFQETWWHKAGRIGAAWRSPHVVRRSSMKNKHAVFLQRCWCTGTAWTLPMCKGLKRWRATTGS